MGKAKSINHLKIYNNRGGIPIKSLKKFREEAYFDFSLDITFQCVKYNVWRPSSELYVT